MKTICVLGTIYMIVVRRYEEEEAFKRRGIFAFCDSLAKEIVICNPITYPDWEHEDNTSLDKYFKHTLRHEIIHAFLFESGLAQDSKEAEAWATNEEMVDWFAWQGQKIIDAWETAEKIVEWKREAQHCEGGGDEQ